MQPNEAFDAMSSRGVAVPGPATQTPVAANDPLPSATKLRKFFDDFRSITTDSRQEALNRRRYYDGDQLDAKMKAALRRRKQPEMPINYVRAAVNGIVGVVIQNPTDPRAYGRTPDAQDAADVASMVLRYCADVNHFDQIKADCLENGVIEGPYAVIVECDGDNADPAVTAIPWEEFFYDPHSKRSDFADAKYLGSGKWMYADHLAILYGDVPEAAEALSAMASTGQMNGWGDETWLDRPVNALPWVDDKKRRLMVVEVYYQEGADWFRCVYTAGGILEHGKSAYVDDKGRTACPIVASCAYIDSDNVRYGPVKDLMPIQDGINMRESKLMHLLNSRQVQQSDPNAPPIDEALARKEAARPDGVLPMGWNIVPTGDQVAGQAQLLTEAKQEILRMSPNPALVGRGGDDASGRAVQIRQQAGLTELARVLGRFSDWELRCFKAMWQRCRQFWKDPKWIRVADDEGAPKFVRVNDDGPQPVTDPQGQPQMDPATGQPAMQPPQLMVDPQTGQQALHPQTGQPMVQPKNHIAMMDVDIIVDTVPETSDLQQEVDKALMDVLRVNPNYAQSIPFSVAFDLFYRGPNKREQLEKIETAQKQAQAQQAQQQLAQMQVQEQQHNAQLAAQQADVEKTQSETAQNVADARKTGIQGTAEALRAHIEADAAPVQLAGHHIANQVAADPGVAGVANPA